MIKIQTACCSHLSDLVCAPFARSVRLRLEEKINLTAGRDGGLQNLEVLGLLTLKITDDACSKIKIGVANNDTKGIQLQVGV